MLDNHMSITCRYTVNKEMYIDILRHLRVVVKMKCPEMWGANSWFLLPGNSPAYWLVFGQGFRSKE
jgi:hypothetical protein